MSEQSEKQIIEDAKKALETEFAAELALISQKHSSQIQRQRQQNQINQQNFPSSQNTSKKKSGGWERIVILSLSLIYIVFNFKKEFSQKQVKTD
jgi:DNA-binding transcriptional regulator YiaG